MCESYLIVNARQKYCCTCNPKATQHMNWSEVGKITIPKNYQYSVLLLIMISSDFMTVPHIVKN